MSVVESTEAAYRQHRDYVLAVLSRRCGWLDADEREAAFHDAYAVMLEKERDGRLDADEMHPQQVRAYLTQTAIHKALDEGKRVERKRSEPLDERGLVEPDAGAAPDELAAASLDNARLREIVAELPERQQTIVKLRYFFDRTPEEIQRYIGISERAYRRELERAMRQLAERYELVREGRYCDSRRSLILAYVGGFAGPNRALEARSHLSTCPGCAHWAAELRTATRKAAELLPVPPVVQDQGFLARVGEAGAALRDSVTDLKQHALSVVTRTDPGVAGYAAAARPGTVAAAIAGCLALSGGATYCAVEGIPYPLRALVGSEPAKKKAAERPKVKPRRAAVKTTAQPTPVATPAPTPEPKAQPKRQKAKPASRPRAAPADDPAPVQEFGLEGSGQPATSAAPAPASPPPAGPPGEFDP